MTQVQSLLSCVHTRATARIEANPESLLSCRYTRATARIEADPESVPLAAQFRVQLCVHDLDDLPVNFTRAEISRVRRSKHPHAVESRVEPVRCHCACGAHWAAGALRSLGEGQQRVERNGAGSELRAAAPVELLRRRIIVKEGSALLGSLSEQPSPRSRLWS